MIRVSELRKWLDTLEPDDLVGIDEGGLTMELVCEQAEASEDDSCYIEIGGIPADDDEKPEDDGNGPNRFLNHYKCPKDGTEWSDESQYTNNDRCPNCDLEVSPTESEDL